MLVQRKGLGDVVAFEKRPARTAVDDCNIAENIFISQIYNVQLEQKLNSSTNVEIKNVKPPYCQTLCCTPFYSSSLMLFIFFIVSKVVSTVSKSFTSN